MRGADTSEPCQDLEDKRDLGAPSPAVSADNQWKDKRVESPSWLCLDGGSTPPISTDKKMAFQLCWGPFSISGDTRLQGKRFSFSTPVSCADSPFQWHAACAFGSGRWLRCFDFLAEVSLTLRHGG